MTLGSVAAILCVLMAVVIFGNLWFHFVEAVLKVCKKAFFRRKEYGQWHTLPSNAEENDVAKGRQD